ncbi:MAG: serine protease [Agriterribacter sp.]
MKILKSLLLLPLFFLIVSLSIAQVKTKIYDKEIPSSLIKKGENLVALRISAPDKLAEKKVSEGKSQANYSNQFAISKTVDIDILKQAKIIEDNGNTIYSLLILAEDALNISVQFSKFILSKNTVLSIYTKNELTDSITFNENNEKNIWATRVYQGNQLTIVLTVPTPEKNEIALTANKILFGYKETGGSFSGNPGASATCNINAICAAGNGWENERNSVALIVVDGEEECTGTLVMNTCNTNRPYVLTANHCLVGSLNNWVFQYQTWSNTCATNGTFREDVQFNGCTLRANNCELDFALVEMNQTPASNSGIRYAGWSRTAVAPGAGASLHHPRGDLMKISTFNTAAVAVTWNEPGNPCPSAVANHWRVTYNQGIVQHGSSGAALFNQDHRVVGQLHGNQNNICGNPGTNACWCTTQIPAIGEYGRFDLSWAGGGTNATRLSNWLDPNNTGAVTTNTTNISALVPPAITGDFSTWCSYSNRTFTVTATAGTTYT